MESTVCRLRALKIKLPILALTLAVLGHASVGYSQQTAPPPAASEIDLTNVRPGVWCDVWRKPVPETGLRPAPDDGGTVKQITKTEIVVGRISEGRNEYRTPILGDLPFVNRFFTKTQIGRTETVSRIPIERIAKIKILEPGQPATRRREQRPADERRSSQ